MVNEEESKYAQQHLANERTFLAWVRTVISIMGVGFLTTTVHFELGNGLNLYADRLIKVIGLVTLALAFTASIFSAYSYLNKRTGINRSSFRSTANFVIVLSSTLVVTLILMAIYLIFAY